MRAILTVLIAGLPSAALAQDSQEGPAAGMTTERIEAVVKRIDPDFATNDAHTAWEFHLDSQQMLIVSDPNADRMRIMAPIAPTGILTPERMKRMLQANHDSALDARYSIAQDIIWSTFIHPLSPLGEAELISGLRQTFTAARTFGTTYSSGVFTFGGGDSQGILEALERELEDNDVPL